MSERPISGRRIRSAVTRGLGQGLGRVLVCALPALGLLAGTAAAQPKQVVFATTGGTFEKTLRELWFEPFTKATGIEVVSVSATDAEQRTRAQSMVQASRVTWDLFINVDVLAASPQNRAITQDLSEFCKNFTDRKDLLDGTCKAEGVRISYNATLLAFNADRFKGEKPQSWKDFWNVAAFPGPRALPNFGDPWRIYAAALMADGVPGDKLFPLDIERAQRKLDEIKPSIQLWWKTGDQSQQGFRNGDYIIGMIWGTRANALLAESQPVQVSFDQAFLLGDRVQLLRDAPNRDGALALVKYYLERPAIQAQFAERLGVTPASLDAIAMMSEAARRKIPSNAEAFKRVVTPDAEWINANQNRLIDSWNSWIQK